MPRESGVERYLVDEVRNRGGEALKLTGYLGVPDRLVLLNGKAAFAETKAPAGRLSSAQRIWSARLARIGFMVWFPRTRDDVREFLAYLNV